MSFSSVNNDKTFNSVNATRYRSLNSLNPYLAVGQKVNVPQIDTSGIILFDTISELGTKEWNISPSGGSDTIGILIGCPFTAGYAVFPDTSGVLPPREPSSFLSSHQITATVERSDGFRNSITINKGEDLLSNPSFLRPFPVRSPSPLDSVPVVQYAIGMLSEYVPNVTYKFKLTIREQDSMIPVTPIILGDSELEDGDTIIFNPAQGLP